MKGRAILLAAAVVACAVVPYLRAPANGFAWDDFDTIVDNADVHSLGNLGRVLVSPDLTPPYFRPLTRALFALLWAVFGADPVAFHVVSIALHAAAALLLFVLGRSLLRRDGPAFALSAVFAAHTVNVEAVAFLSANNNVLATLFVILTLLAARRDDARRPGGFGWLSGLALLAALGSKETGILALVLLPFFGTAREPATWRARLLPLRRWRPHVLALGVYLVWRFAALEGLLGTPVSVSHEPTGPFVALWSFARGLRLAVWPAPLTVLHAPPAATAGAVVAAALPLTALAGFALWFALSRRMTALGGVVWFAAALAPALGSVAIPSAAFGERYLYLALPGLLIVAAGFVPRRAEVPAAVVAVGLAVLCGVFTSARVADWRDNRTLFESALRVAPHPTAHLNLGNWHKDHGDLARAEEHWRAAVDLDPRDADAWTQLGVAAAIRRDFRRARICFERALSIEPGHPVARANLDRVNRLPGGRR
jgi:hypothetical protein